MRYDNFADCDVKKRIVMDQPLWKPSSTALTQTQMAKFIKFVNGRYSLTIQDYFSLYRWSITNLSDFWGAIWDFCDVSAAKNAEHIFMAGKTMRDAQWFKGARLNFAENLLKRRDDHPAIIFVSEQGERKTLSYAELYYQVKQLTAYLKSLDIQPGDRIAGFLSNTPETVIAVLATTSLGAIWTSCSPDFGIEGLMDRFDQIEPKVLFAVDTHHYHGKIFHHLEKIQNLQKSLTHLKKTILISSENINPEKIGLNNTVLYQKIMNESKSPDDLEFKQLPFNHPVYILYSSGTTGKPKCMVHGAGNILLQHLKELMLHTDLRAEDKIFFYTTCGWMMWNWLVSSLAVGATVVLYDGSPTFPQPQRLFDLIDEVGISVFGVGAKLIESAEKSSLHPQKTHTLKTLRTILTTGSPLLPESFDYVYEKIKTDVCLSSISGGSDIVSLFAGGNPLLPVYRGELQCICLGMDVQIFNDEGQAVVEKKGELVCTTPFTAMPIYFWNDPLGEKYENAYFKKYPGVWAHGDYALMTKHQGMIIYGRSDATLNPKGIRIGTAEIYSQIEKFAQIVDSIAVGQNWEGSERIILFVKLKNGAILSAELIEKIKKMIRENTSPHHVPAKIIAVPDLPRTLSGKLVEIAVKKMIHGEAVKNVDALANPESLNYFRDISELAEN